MKKPGKSVGGFTLIELTVVLSVIAILAAIAIPNFLSFIAKSKQSEAKAMLTMIAAYENDYKLRHGQFIACPKNPQETKNLLTWTPNQPGWTELGFSPLGLRYYQYEVVLKDNSFVVRAEGNIDADKTLDEWELNGATYLLKNSTNDVYD